MLIGTQYFRPPNPEPEVWETDLRQIAALEMSLVRCWVYWRCVEPREGDWGWDHYDRFMELARQNGLDVVMQFIPECQPNWFLQRHRDLWPRNEHGDEYGQEGYGMVTIGGYPGISFDQPPAAEAIARFYRETVNRYRHHPALHTWDVWNEIQPHAGFISYDACTTTRWRGYLESTFGTIDNLNRRMLTQYAAFDEIPMKRPGITFTGPQQWHVLFHEFRHWRVEDEMAHRAALIRAIDTDHPVVAHSSNTPMTNLAQNEWRFAKHLDGYGTSQYLTEYTTKPAADYRYAAMYVSVKNTPW